MKASKKAIKALALRLTTILLNAEELRPLYGRRIVGAAFNSEAEGAYTLTFDDGSYVNFSSQGDDATVTTVVLSPFQQKVVNGGFNSGGIIS